MWPTASQRGGPSIIPPEALREAPLQCSPFHQLKSVLLSLIFKLLLFLCLANLTGGLAYPYSVCQHSLSEVIWESCTFFAFCTI